MSDVEGEEKKIDYSIIIPIIFILLFGYVCYAVYTHDKPEIHTMQEMLDKACETITCDCHVSDDCDCSYPYVFYAPNCPIETMKKDNGQCRIKYRDYKEVCL